MLYASYVMYIEFSPRFLENDIALHIIVAVSSINLSVKSVTPVTFVLNVICIYPRAMKTQHPNVHQYLTDIWNILSQRISGDFINTKDRHHFGFITFNVKCPNVYTHAHFPTGISIICIISPLIFISIPSTDAME